MKPTNLAASSGTAEMNWGIKIKRFRVGACMTQVALAEILRVDPTTISRWERGRDKPDLGTQRRLRTLMEPTVPYCPNCKFAMGLISSFLESGSEVNLPVLQLARAELARMKRETCRDQG
jgi:DNA-binding XRE family transcriptional regulator